MQCIPVTQETTSSACMHFLYQSHQISSFLLAEQKYSIYEEFETYHFLSDIRLVFLHQCILLSVSFYPHHPSSILLGAGYCICSSLELARSFLLLTTSPQ